MAQRDATERRALEAAAAAIFEEADHLLDRVKHLEQTLPEHVGAAAHTIDASTERLLQAAASLQELIERLDDIVQERMDIAADQALRRIERELRSPARQFRKDPFEATGLVDTSDETSWRAWFSSWAYPLAGGVLAAMATAVFLYLW